MFRFANPEYLYLLFVLPVLIAIYIYAVIARRKAIKKYGNPDLLAQLMPEVSVKRLNTKYWIFIAAISILVFVIAGPQFGSKLETVKRQGVEIMVCLDVSNSMMSEDVSPNRLERAKNMLSRMTDSFTDDKVGLIVFAGDAFTQLPITADYISAKMFLSSINPSMVSTQGTAIGAAITLAMRSFTPNESSSKTILIITDGENHEGDAIKAAVAAAEKNVKINVVSIGTPQGAPIPVSGGSNYLKDKEGNVVVTQLNEQMCQEIAAAGKGIYVRADNTNSALRTLQNEIDKMDKAELDGKIYSEFDEQFHTLAWIVLALLLIELLMLERKNRIFRKVKLFS
ncbi:MAG: VWA domain-containing protein [Tannerella sp.]|jgi:Ca-activated chloride channel family protein|nr:VWA domain-containing protein [Tannerella sp.]